MENQLEKKIYMLSTTDCTKCPIVKQQLGTKNVEVEYINNDQDPELASELGIMSVPSIIDNRNGSEIQFVGLNECMALVSTL